MSANKERPRTPLWIRIGTKFDRTPREYLTIEFQQYDVTPVPNWFFTYRRVVRFFGLDRLGT